MLNIMGSIISTVLKYSILIDVSNFKSRETIEANTYMRVIKTGWIGPCKDTLASLELGPGALPDWFRYLFLFKIQNGQYDRGVEKKNSHPSVR